jgi:hypothetical protein
MRPIILRMAWQVARAVKILIIGSGGMATANDALEYLMVGCSAVIGTINLCADGDAEVIDGIEASPPQGSSWAGTDGDAPEAGFQRTTGGVAWVTASPSTFGGTFTDAVPTDGGGSVVAIKVPTTPANRADGVMNGACGRRAAGVAARHRGSGARIDHRYQRAHRAYRRQSDCSPRRDFATCSRSASCARTKACTTSPSIACPARAAHRCLEAIERLDAAGAVHAAR